MQPILDLRSGYPHKRRLEHTHKKQTVSLMNGMFFFLALSFCIYSRRAYYVSREFFGAEAVMLQL
jgi:hypothetical protein